MLRTGKGRAAAAAVAAATASWGGKQVKKEGGGKSRRRVGLGKLPLGLEAEGALGDGGGWWLAAGNLSGESLSLPPDASGSPFKFLPVAVSLGRGAPVGRGWEGGTRGCWWLRVSRLCPKVRYPKQAARGYSDERWVFAGLRLLGGRRGWRGEAEGFQAAVAVLRTRRLSFPYIAGVALCRKKKGGGE